MVASCSDLLLHLTQNQEGLSTKRIEIVGWEEPELGDYNNKNVMKFSFKKFRIICGDYM